LWHPYSLQFVMSDLIPVENGIFHGHPGRFWIAGSRLQFIPYLMRGGDDIHF
jgi:hypothetical protein